ncbi:hypothetical protein HHI36_010567 [Cryptolaemus montrouzieri]|uniref:Uncharacterized protein n=1 Tax=Cryptolaemus montrouzieri TaxID=559131 RepID=A0ABD2MJ25_9CUCU
MRYKYNKEENNFVPLGSGFTPINVLLSYAAFQKGLNTKNSSQGPDEIPFVFGENLPEMQNIFLQYSNKIWTELVFPELWLEFTFISITKPGKPKSGPTTWPGGTTV